MDKGEIIRIAREEGIVVSDLSRTAVAATEEIIAFAARIEALTLERAAKVIDRLGSWNRAAECAAAIRALNPKQQEK